MRVLMPASYVAARGGLYDHILEVAQATRAFGVHITVAGAAGPFLDGLSAAGVPTIPTDHTSIEASLAAVAAGGPWDLIHTHPFGARQFSLAAAERLGVPLVATIHGWYLDGVDTWHKDAFALIGVTDAISDRIKAVTGEPEKVHTIENHRKVASQVRAKVNSEGKRLLVVVSRIDRDFEQVSGILGQFIDAVSEHDDNRWQIAVAGTGTHLKPLVAEISRRSGAGAAPDISLLGWLDGPRLSELYARASAVIAPGRAAVDALASGIPTLLTRQIGSYGLAPFGRTLTALYGSSGGSVSGRQFYETCTRLLDDPDKAAQIAAAQQRIANLVYDPEMLTRRLVAIYEAAVLERLAATV